MAYIRTNVGGAGGSGGGAFGADANTQITPSTAVVLDQATGNEAALSLDYTTNKATSGDDTGLLINQTDTASPGTSNLLDLQVGGVSLLQSSAAGGATVFGGTPINSAQLTIESRANDNCYLNFVSSLGKTSNLASISGRLRLFVNDSAGGTARELVNFIAGSGGVGRAFLLNSELELGWRSAAGDSWSAVGSADLKLVRDAANTLGQRNGVNAQTFNTYNTYTDASNYERLAIRWSSNDCHIQTQQAGTGVNRQLHFAAAQFRFTAPAGVNLQANTSLSVSDGEVNITQPVVTSDLPALNIASTWNNAAVPFTLIKADVTDTASAAGSKLMDLQVGGVSKLSVDNAGTLTLPAGSPSQPSLVIGATTNNGFYTSGSTLAYAINGSARLTLDSSGAFWLRTDASNIAIGSSADLRLYRAAAATLQLGTDHATVATGQTIKAHDVVTGTGADLTLSAGTGSVADGDIILTGNVQASGGLTLNTTTVNAATYDLLVTDYLLMVSYTATGAVTSLTLPTAQTTAGRTIVIKDSGGNATTNNITIDTEASQTIDGAATLVIATNYASVTLCSDGTNWLVI